jgi:hypothetical protein
MHPFLTKRLEIPKVWFTAFLFPFKAFTVGATLLLFIWHATLPPNQSNAQTGFDYAWYYAADDFALVASGMSIFYFLAAGVLVIGGLIQLLKYSRRAALWSIAFGIFAFIIGIYLAAFISFPEGNYGIMRIS